MLFVRDCTYGKRLDGSFIEWQIIFFIHHLNRQSDAMDALGSLNAFCFAIHMCCSEYKLWTYDYQRFHRGEKYYCSMQWSKLCFPIMASSKWRHPSLYIHTRKKKRKGKRGARERWTIVVSLRKTG